MRTHLFPQATAIRRLLKAPLDESKSRHDVSKIKQYLKSEWKKILSGKVSSAFAGMQAASTVGLVLLTRWMHLSLASNATYPNGLPSCRCVEWAGLDKYIVGGYLIVKPVGEGVSYKYPKTYGEGSCQAHDHNLPPFCDGSSGGA